MNGVTPSDIYNALLVFLAICGSVTVVGKAVETIKSWRKPAQAENDAFSAALSRHGEQIDRCKDRIDKHDDALDDTKEGQRLLCTGVKALLEHAVHNGNTEDLKAASDKLDKWLINRH